MGDQGRVAKWALVSAGGCFVKAWVHLWQTGWGLEQLGLVQGVPTHGKGVEQEDPLRISSNPNHSRILQASAPAQAHSQGGLSPLPQTEGKQGG